MFLVFLISFTPSGSYKSVVAACFLEGNSSVIQIDVATGGSWVKNVFPIIGN